MLMCMRNMNDVNRRNIKLSIKIKSKFFPPRKNTTENKKFTFVQFNFIFCDFQSCGNE